MNFTFDLPREKNFLWWGEKRKMNIYIIYNEESHEYLIYTIIWGIERQNGFKTNRENVVRKYKMCVWHFIKLNNIIY